VLAATVILALVNAFSWLRDDAAPCEGDSGLWGFENGRQPARVQVESHSRE
jgi:hypothetical protein